MLRVMLDERTRVQNNEIEEKDAELRMGKMLAQKYNVDVDALVKSAKEEMEKKQ